MKKQTTTKRTATVLTFAKGRCTKCGRKNAHTYNCRAPHACKGRRAEQLAKRAA